MENSRAIKTNSTLLPFFFISQGKAQLEKLVDEGYASHTLLFNLSTMYELCSDQAKTLKLRLAERVAGMAPTPSGWEKTNADFKL